MAEVTAFRNNALPYPVYGVPWTIVFPLLDADGDPVTGATCDSEVSKNGDTGADCTNEGTEITFTTATNKGMYYLTLTAAEMTADIVTVTIYSATSKATCVVLYPRKLVELSSGTSQGGAAGYITLAASTVLFNGQYNGCLCVATIDSNVEARVLQVCTASNQQCTVTPSWNVTPDSDDTYKIYLPEGMQFPTANIKALSDDATAPDTLELFAEALDQATGQLDSGTLHDDTITAASINTGALTADAFAADAIVAATLATGAITADAFAADAIVAATLATGVLTADAFAANAITNTAVADDVDVNAKTIAAGAITAASFAAGAIDAAAIANGAIDNATFAADVGSTAYATNIIALAVQKALVELNLDHLISGPTPIDGKSWEAAVRYALAILAGKVSGAGTGTESFFGLDGTTERVRVTAELDGDRTAVSYDPV